MRLSNIVARSVLCLSASSLVIAELVGIPTVPFELGSPNDELDFKSIHSIIVDTKYADVVDTKGETLIPPSLKDFAETFGQDLVDSGSKFDVNVGEKSSPGSIFVTLGDAKDFVDAAGRPTSEGYTLEVKHDGIVITGASPLGVWWGTRTVLQQVALGDGKISTGKGTDSAGWASRGVMLDAARHFYPPGFLVEMCSYLSFFKQNTFHVHLSDNLYNNVDVYSREQQLSLYATFRLLSDDPAVAGLNKRANESYTRAEFDDIQEKCAARGVTIIPEIEAPGHALVISQWKPELGLEDDLSLLNISYADTIPTMETVWKTFLPWFHSKVVHIGADEYVDAALSKDALIEEYTRFVNALNTFITAESNNTKSVRIWGTFPPSTSPGTTNVDPAVSIQHWANFEDNPYLDFIQRNYSVLNSDDATYIVAKYSGSYPQSLNLTRIFSGAPSGAPYAPNIFDLTNAANNPLRSDPRVLGQVAAHWNDYGPNATTVLEAYYAWRDGLPALADKQWGGALTRSQYSSIFDKLHAAVPSQNLDRAIASRGSTIVEYDFTTAADGKVVDKSGNGYDAHTECESGDMGVHITRACAVRTPLGSKGRNYTLSFSVYPLSTSTANASFLSGPDSSLSITGPVTFWSGGNPYALEYTVPVGEWSDARVIARGNQTFFAVGQSEMEFRTRIGVNGVMTVEREMGIEAPVETIGGDGFEGWVKGLMLEDYA